MAVTASCTVPQRRWAVEGSSKPAVPPAAGAAAGASATAGAATVGVVVAGAGAVCACHGWPAGACWPPTARPGWPAGAACRWAALAVPVIQGRSPASSPPPAPAGTLTGAGSTDALSTRGPFASMAASLRSSPSTRSARASTVRSLPGRAMRVRAISRESRWSSEVRRSRSSSPRTSSTRASRSGLPAFLASSQALSAST